MNDALFPTSRHRHRFLHSRVAVPRRRSVRDTGRRRRAHRERSHGSNVRRSRVSARVTEVVTTESDRVMTSFGLDCMGKQLVYVWMKFLFFLQLQLEC